MTPTLPLPPAFRTPAWKGLPPEVSVSEREIGSRYAALIRLALKVLGKHTDPPFEDFVKELDSITASDGLPIAVTYGENLMEVVMFEQDGDEG